MTAAAPSMTPAEFRCLRESLGISTGWFATYLDIAERTILRWEYGRNPLREHAIATLQAIADDAAAVYDEFAAALATDPAAPIRTYRTDDDYRTAEPGSVYPASWHRAIAQRVAWATTGARIEYVQTGATAGQ